MSHSDSILLGYDIPERTIPMGFGASDRNDETREASSVVKRGEGHIIGIAPTGAGKSRSYAMPIASTYQGNCFILDVKGELCRETSALRRKMGHRVYRLDPYDIGDAGPDGAVKASLNPIDILDPHSHTFIDDAMMMASAIVLTGSLRDPHWEIRAREFLSGFLCLAAMMPSDLSNLSGVRRMLTADVTIFGAALSVMQSIEGPASQFMSSCSTGLLAIPDKERGSVMSTMARDLFASLAVGMRKAADSSSFHPFEFADEEGVTIYVCIPPERLRTLSPFIRLWVSVIITGILRRRRRPAIRDLIILDEVAQLGKFDLLTDMLTLIRGYGADVFAMFQDVSQIQATYGEEWRTIVNNCKAVLSFGLRTPRLVRDACDLVGFADTGALSGYTDDRVLLSMGGAEPKVITRPTGFIAPQIDKQIDNKKTARPRQKLTPGRAGLENY